jgi:hypothetical protein
VKRTARIALDLMAAGAFAWWAYAVRQLMPVEILFGGTSLLIVIGTIQAETWPRSFGLGVALGLGTLAALKQAPIMLVLEIPIVVLAYLPRRPIDATIAALAFALPIVTVCAMVGTFPETHYANMMTLVPIGLAIILVSRGRTLGLVMMVAGAVNALASVAIDVYFHVAPKWQQHFEMPTALMLLVACALLGALLPFIGGIVRVARAYPGDATSDAGDPLRDGAGRRGGAGDGR